MTGLSAVVKSPPRTDELSPSEHCSLRSTETQTPQLNETTQCRIVAHARDQWDRRIFWILGLLVFSTVATIALLNGPSLPKDDQYATDAYWDTSFGPFDEPSEDEYFIVLDVLRQHIPELYAFDVDTGLKAESYSQLATLPWFQQLQANTLWTVKLHDWNKHDLWSYLDTQRMGFDTASLQRKAVAIVFHGSEETPVVREYVVGPLDSAEPQVELLREIPYLRRPLVSSEYGALLDYLAVQFAILDPVLQEAYEASYFMPTPSPRWIPLTEEESDGATLCRLAENSHNGARPECLIPTFASPLVTYDNATARKTLFRLNRQVPAFIQHPVDLQLEVDHTSLNPTDWVVTWIWFQGQTFQSVQHLLDDYKAGLLRIVPMPFVNLYPESVHEESTLFSRTPTSTQTTGNFASRKESLLNTVARFPEKRANNDKTREPTSRTFDRFPDRRIQINRRRVQYLLWDFHLTVRRETGLRVYGVRFANKSLVTEAGLDETVTTYWGHSPFMQKMTSQESMFGVGAMLGLLSPGIDCPHDAIYLPIRMIPSFDTGPTVFQRGVCIFEWLVDPPAGPLRRHTEFDSSGQFHTDFASGHTSRALVVRFVSALFNYDYLFDIVFHSSGTIEFAVTPTGYVHVDTNPMNRIQPHSTRPWNTKEAYGFAHNFAPYYFVIHQHLFHFKVDLDIDGRSNLFKVVSVHGPANYPQGNSQAQSPGRVNAGWCPSLWMSTQLVTRELDARVTTKFEHPKQFLICSAAEDQGTDRCMQLINKGAVQTVLSDEHTNTFSWSRHQLVVTRQRDTEQHSSSVYNGVDLTFPTVDFQKFSLDNESIFKEDLVLWVTLGNVHIPRQEDLPNTVTSSGRLAFVLQPHNLFRHSPDAYGCDRVYTKNVEEWLTGYQENSQCAVEPVPAL